MGKYLAAMFAVAVVLFSSSEKCQADYYSFGGGEMWCYTSGSYNYVDINADPSNSTSIQFTGDSWDFNVKINTADEDVTFNNSLPTVVTITMRDASSNSFYYMSGGTVTDTDEPTFHYYGTNGDDYFLGGAKNDIASMHDGDNHASLGAGIDSYTGGADDDECYSGDGVDIVDGKGGTNDTLDQGGGTGDYANGFENISNPSP